jgi:acetate CoA/acetoacetate CoA-transferase beta subunit
LIVTELAVIEPGQAGLMLRETAPGVTVEQVVSATGARLIVPDDVHEMRI